MARTLTLLLLLAYALVPPGICSCRLQGILLTGQPTSCPSDQDDDQDDEHGCECARIQQDCVVAAPDCPERPAASGLVSLPASEPLCDGAVFASPSSEGFHPPDSSPLYLKLRALLI